MSGPRPAPAPPLSAFVQSMTTGPCGERTMFSGLQVQEQQPAVFMWNGVQPRVQVGQGANLSRAEPGVPSRV